MSNKSSDSGAAGVAGPGGGGGAVAADTVFPFGFLLFTLLQVLVSLPLLLGKDAGTSSSNAVSIVCLSTWIWLLWDPFVFIFNLREVETKEDDIIVVALEN